MEHFPYGGGRYMEFFLLLVHPADAPHLLEVGHVAGANGLPAIHPYLAELQGPAVPLGHIGHPKLALLPPAFDLYATGDDHIAHRLHGEPFVFWADDDGLGEAVGAGLEFQNGVVGHVAHLHQAGFLKGSLNGERAGLHFDDEVARCLGLQGKAEGGEQTGQYPAGIHTVISLFPRLPHA